jgi:hypothetical protein
LSTAVWAGFPGNEVEMSPPTTPITVYGGTWPAQIWQRFMAAAQGDAPPTDFAAPPPPTTTTTAVPHETTTIPGELHEVPDVRGMSYGAAAREIAGAGFTPSRFDIATDAWPAGTVSGQSPPGGSTSPRGALVTLEVAMPHGDSVTVPNVFGMKRDAAVSALHDSGLAVDVIEEESPDNNHERGLDGDDLREPGRVTEPGRGRLAETVVAVVVVAFVLAFALFWIYVLFIAPSARQDKLQDAAFARAAQPVCVKTIADLQASNVVNQTAASPPERADLVERSDARLTIMVRDLRALTPATGGDRVAVTAWLDDWDQWLRDRVTWVGKLRAGQDAPFDEKARDNGEPYSKALNAFAITNEMPACATPFGV